MGATGTKKLPPKNMKTKTATQYCIDGVLVDEVLKELSSKCKIIGAKIVLGKSHNKHKCAIPNSLKRLGVTELREHLPAKEAMLTFDAANKTVIRDKVKAVAQAIGAEPEKAWFKYLTLDNGKGQGKFIRTSKEIKPYDEDQRRKLNVLGLSDATGKVSSLVSDLSAKKYECRIQMTEVRTIICSKIG